MKWVIALLGLLSFSPFASADEAWYGTWVERSATPMTMIMEGSGGGTKVTYHIPAANLVLSYDTRMDGNEVPVLINGKDSGEVMIVKRIDDRHAANSWKIQGKQAGTSKSELSADGKVLEVENDNAISGRNGAAGKITQYWDKK